MTPEQIEGMFGTRIVDADGEEVGRVHEVFTDPDSGEPTWMTVTTGLFGSREIFIPAAGATVTEDEIRVPYDKDVIAGSPPVDEDARKDDSGRSNLYLYYGLDVSG